MDDIAMNEYNVGRYRKEFSDLLIFMEKNKIPFVKDNNSINIIAPFPNKLTDIIDMSVFESSISGGYIHYYKSTSFFLSEKPDYGKFKAVFEYLQLKANR